MKNKLSDLNNHLFAQLERLGDEELKPEQIAAEVDRAKAIVGVASQIVSAQALNLRAVELVAEYGERFHDKLTMLEAPK
ncbi:MAG: hypothetical protein Q8S03_10335 [Brevundimonas sp.]|uniref:hypothetical protein n=1 Tax=Brevundimonas sp. TaxID=1871086 RepID=UPI0027376086|nr:hypothetical protein [Brevundimonas sp.]MDP3405077.1 hypothetical protein [Brevundimonas sp.]